MVGSGATWRGAAPCTYRPSTHPTHFDAFVAGAFEEAARAYIPEGAKCLAEKHHIQIATGLGTLKDRIIRIGHMSPTGEEDIDEVVDALAGFRVR